MPPESEFPDRMTAHGVWLPLPLAQALFLCYYGSGPRCGERSPAPPAPPSASPITPPSALPPSLISRPGPTMRPRGALARDTLPAKEPSRDGPPTSP